MTIAMKADPTGTKGIILINGVEKLEVNSDGTVKALTPVSASDVTPGRFVQMGDLGFGAAGIAVTDYNNATIGGTIYYADTAATNGPPIAGNYLVFVMNRAAGYLTQYAHNRDGVSSGRVFVRTQAAGAWSSWKTLYSQDTILGAVAQSGGVPTGAVIERGSNANGDYVKFADGTLICAITGKTVADLTNRQIVTSNTGGGYRSGESSLIFPVAFSANPVVFGEIRNNSEGIRVNTYTTTTSSFNTTLITSVNSIASPTTTTPLYFFAIGRWF